MPQGKFVCGKFNTKNQKVDYSTEYVLLFDSSAQFVRIYRNHKSVACFSLFEFLYAAQSIVNTLHWWDLYPSEE